MGKREIFICDICSGEIEVNAATLRLYGKAIISFKDLYHLQTIPLDGEICNDCAVRLEGVISKEILYLENREKK